MKPATAFSFHDPFIKNVAPVEVCTDAVEYPGTELILLPLLRVELQHGLVNQVVALRHTWNIHALVW